MEGNKASSRKVLETARSKFGFETLRAVFHRFFVQGNASQFCNPPGGFGFNCEITYNPHKPLPRHGEDLIELCIRDPRRVGFIRGDDPILATAIVDLPAAYVVYDHGRKERAG